MLEKLKKSYYDGKVSIRFVEDFCHEKTKADYTTSHCALIFPENEGIIRINYSSYQVGHGDLILVCPDNKIGFDLLGQSFKHINLYFNCPNLKSFEFIQNDSIDDLKKILKDIQVEAKSTYYKSFKIDFLLQMFFNTLFKDSTYKKQDNIIVLDIIKYLEENIHRSFKLSDIAKHFDLSTSRLSYIFNKYTGKGPIDYFIDHKIDKAIELLWDQDLKILDIAQCLGYEDPYYFSRLFKKRTGLSPNTYREKFIRP